MRNTRVPSFPDGRASITRGMTLLMAVACGLIVANIYYVQPLAGPIAASLGLSKSATGLLVTLTQIGYGLGLLLLVPLCDLLENRRMIVSMLGVAAVALVLAGLAPSALLFLSAALVIGGASTAVQMLVPFAASMALEEHRGRVVGRIVSGLMLGIMMARPLASFGASISSWHAVFLTASAVMVLVAAVLVRLLPRRVPDTTMSYRGLLRSMVTLAITEPVLRARSTYQFFLFASFTLFWTVIPLLLADAPFHLTQRGIGLFALTGVTGAIASPLAGYLADKGLTRAVTIAGILTVIIGYTATYLPFAGVTAMLAALAAAAILIGFGLTLNVVIGQRAIFTLAPELRSRLNGLFGASAFVGGALGAALGGWAYARGGWAGAAALGTLFPAAALGYCFFDNRQPKAR